MTARMTDFRGELDNMAAAIEDIMAQARAQGAPAAFVATAAVLAGVKHLIKATSFEGAAEMLRDMALIVEARGAPVVVASDHRGRRFDA